MNEPLKNKKTIAKRLGDDLEDYYCFKPSDVKSAVEWLKGQLFNMDTVIFATPTDKINCRYWIEQAFPDLYPNGSDNSCLSSIPLGNSRGKPKASSSCPSGK